MSPAETFPAPTTLQLALETGEIWNVTNAEGAGWRNDDAPLGDDPLGEHRLCPARSTDSVPPPSWRWPSGWAPLLPSREQPRRSVGPPLSGPGERTRSTCPGDGDRVRHPGDGRRPSRRSVRVLCHRRSRHRAVVRQHDRRSRPRSAIASVANEILNEAVLYGTGTAANIGRAASARRAPRWTTTTPGSWAPSRRWSVWVLPQGMIRMEPPRTRITVFGGTWPARSAADAGGDRRTAGDDVPEPRGGVRLRLRGCLADAQLPAEPVHAPAEHRDPAVHRGNGAHGDVHVTVVAPGGARSVHGRFLE